MQFPLEVSPTMIRLKFETLYLEFYIVVKNNGQNNYDVKFESNHNEMIRLAAKNVFIRRGESVRIQCVVMRWCMESKPHHLVNIGHWRTFSVKLTATENVSKKKFIWKIPIEICKRSVEMAREAPGEECFWSGEKEAQNLIDSSSKSEDGLRSEPDDDSGTGESEDNSRNGESEPNDEGLKRKKGKREKKEKKPSAGPSPSKSKEYIRSDDSSSDEEDKKPKKKEKKKAPPKEESESEEKSSASEDSDSD